MMTKTNKPVRRRAWRPGWMSLLQLNAYDLGRLSVGDLDELDAADARRPDAARAWR